MTRWALIAGVLFALAACGGPSSDREDEGHPRHGKTSSTKPGISISGDVRVGVVGVY